MRASTRPDGYTLAVATRKRLPDRRPFTAEQNAILRSTARALLTMERNQTALAKELDVSQPFLSRFLLERENASIGFAKKIATLAGSSLGQLLSFHLEIDQDDADPYPNRAKAISVAPHVGIVQRAIDTVRGVDLGEGEDPPATWWLGELLRANYEAERAPKMRR